MVISFTKPAATVSIASAAPTIDPSAVSRTDDGAQAPAGRMLVDLFQYLERHALEHSALLPAITGMRDAVAGYRSGTPETALDGVRNVVALINQARFVDPGLPEP